MTRSGTGDAHAEPEGPDQFDMTLEDTDGELSSPQGGDGQATAERAPGIVDQGRVAMFVEESDRTPCPTPARRRRTTSG